MQRACHTSKSVFVPFLEFNSMAPNITSKIFFLSSMPKSMVSNSSVLFAHDSRPHFLTFKLVCPGYGLEKKKHRYVVFFTINMAAVHNYVEFCIILKLFSTWHVIKLFKDLFLFIIWV